MVPSQKCCITSQPSEVHWEGRWPASWPVGWKETACDGSGWVSGGYGKVWEEDRRPRAPSPNPHPEKSWQPWQQRADETAKNWREENLRLREFVSKERERGREKVCVSTEWLFITLCMTYSSGTFDSNYLGSRWSSPMGGGLVENNTGIWRVLMCETLHNNIWTNLSFTVTLLLYMSFCSNWLYMAYVG